VNPRQELALADQHSAELEERIAEQLQRIEHLRASGRIPLTPALLRVMELSLALLRSRRQQLADELVDE
jgi:hypothetical protein